MDYEHLTRNRSTWSTTTVGRIGYPKSRLWPSHNIFLHLPHPPYKVPSLSYHLSTLLSISSWVYLSLHYHLPAVSQFSLTNTTHLSSQHGQTISAISNHQIVVIVTIMHKFISHSTISRFLNEIKVHF